MPGPMFGALGEGICGGIPWERGWDPIGFIPKGLRADMGPWFPGPIIRGFPWWFIAMPLFADGKFGERAGGESSSELATVFMASW